MVAQADHAATVKNALLAVSAGDLDELRKHFSDTATFFLPGSVYRIEGLTAFFEGTRTFIEAGGSVQYVDIRQVMVHGNGSDADAAVVTFHFVRRGALDGTPLSATTGRGTAVLAGGKVEHLHITENTDIAPIASAPSATPATPDAMGYYLAGQIGQAASVTSPSLQQVGLTPMASIVRSPAFARLAMWGTS